MGCAYKFFGFTFPILFLTSLCLLCTYQLCFLFPLPFPSFSPHPPASWTVHVCVVHISSLTSPFPILFLTSPYSVPTHSASYSLYLFLPLPLLSLSTDNPPCDLHFCEICSCSSCLLSFCFRCSSVLLGSFVDSCEFIVILFIFLVFFFLDKSL